MPFELILIPLPLCPLSFSSPTHHSGEWQISSSSRCQASVRVQASFKVIDFFFLAYLQCYNDQLSVVFLPMLPPLSITHHCSIRRINLSALNHSGFSSLSSDKIYVCHTSCPISFQSHAVTGECYQGWLF